MNDPKLPYGSIILCAKCNDDNWVQKTIERRNRTVRASLDLECGTCGADYCAKNRKYVWNDYKEKT